MSDATQVDAAPAATPKRRAFIGPEDVNKWRKAAMRALGDNEVRRKWGDTKAGGPVTVMVLCDDVSRLQIERAEMLVALRDTFEMVQSAWGEHFESANETEQGDCAHLCPAFDCQNLGCITGKIQRARAAIAKAEAG